MDKSFFVVFFLSFFVAGCASISVETDPTPADLLTVSRQNNFAELDGVFKGMSLSQVMATLKQEVIIGYEREDASGKNFKPIILKQPYRVEIFQKQDHLYHVLFYFNRVQKADGMISDDELIPLIFEKDQLLAQGWDHLFKVRSEGL